MKKRIVIACVLLLIVGVILKIWISADPYQKQEKIADEYQKIYELLKDEDYKIAKIEDEKIVLYDDNNVKEKEIPLDTHLSQKPKYIENRGTNVVFWYKGFDDLDGIMFLSGAWSDDVWNGVVKMTKLRGNVYYVATYR